MARNNRQGLITALLVGLLVGGGHLPGRLDSLVFYLVVFGVALIDHAKNRFLNILLALSALSFLLAWLKAFQNAHFDALFGISGLACLLYSVHASIRAVFDAKDVGRDEAFAVVNCYLIIGFSWALLYTLAEGFAPGSFTIPTKPAGLLDAFIYFSFGTMTTVGYGDILPRSVLAQRLGVVQAMFGQFYFALVVAYLLNKLFQRRSQGA